MCELDGRKPKCHSFWKGANPEIKGIGTFLLNEFEKLEVGKRIYLYTDTGCTYQFYEHRGFEKVGEKPVSL